jgi:manganese-dependent inorganic pyrophosphatase
MVGKKPVDEIVRLDMKEYGAAELSFAVSQVEVNSPDEIMERSDEVLAELRAMRKAGGYYFSALMVTDITELSSILLVEGDRDFVSMLRYPRLGPGIFELKDVLSRKKQLVPLLIELVEKTISG